MRAAVERIGYPIIVKPIAGAGSADTYTARTAEELERALERTRHVDEVSVEEYIEGEEYTYDTICAGGDVLFQNVAWYRPKPLLIARSNPWISPQAICLRDIERPRSPMRRRARPARAGARSASRAASRTWSGSARPNGEAVFGEIGARAPGGAARARHELLVRRRPLHRLGRGRSCHGRLSQDTHKQYNAAVIFKRASGSGTRIARIEGFEPILAEWGDCVPLIDMVPVGAPRRDPHQVVTGDGWMVARHPDLETLLRLADRLSNDVRVLAG